MSCRYLLICRVCILCILTIAGWLDDIGLPQYKDYFLDARIDGRMLHYMTVEDLIALKVVNTLHHLSIRRGIQVLRINDFNPACLKRRPVPEEVSRRLSTEAKC